MNKYTLEMFSITVSGGKITDVDGATIDHPVQLYDGELSRDQVIEMVVRGFQKGPRNNDLFSDHHHEEPSTNVLIALRGDGKMQLINGYDDLIWVLHDIDWRSAKFYQVAIEDDLL